jgi:UDP-glucose 4-epimerase
MSIATAVVSGGTGFIGSALVRRLSAQGTRVVCLVRPDSPRRARLDALAGVRVADLDDLEGAGLPRDAVVFNLASYGVSPMERDPEMLVEGNATLLVRLLGAAASAGARRVIHVGSCAEYAPAREPALVGEEHPLSTASVYGAAKAAAYLVGTARARQLDLPMVTLRLFGTYGPGEAPHRLIPHVVRHLAAGQRVELTSGTQVRDLTYVDDVVDACVAAARSDALEAYGVYNVCSGVPVRIRDVALTVARLMGKPAERLAFGEVGLRDYENAWLVGDPARFRAATNTKPRIELEEGIRRSIAALTSAP